MAQTDRLTKDGVARPVSPAAGRSNRSGGETAIHSSAKAALTRALRSRGLVAEVEVPLHGAAEERRADILVTGPAGDRVAIEVQHSPIATEALLARTRDYRALGLRILWLPTLDLAALRPQRLGPGRLWAVPRFALPRWHAWIEAQQGGLWYWAEGALWRAWAEPLPRAERLRAHDRDTDTPTAARLCALTLQGPFDPAAVRIHARAADPGPDTRFTLAPGASAAVVLTGERRRPSSPTELAWNGAEARPLIQPRLLRAG